jgi:hypothetical protein
MNSRTLGCVAIVLGAVGACGGSTDTSLSSGGALALSDIPPRYAAAYCTALQNCLGPLFTVAMGGTDCTAQTTQRIVNGDFSMFQSKVDAGKMTYDGSKAQGCIDAIAARTCDALDTRPIPACQSAIDGTISVGADCDLDAECKGGASGAFCQSASGTCPGKCTALLVAGQTCTKNDQCASGLECSKLTTKCVQPSGAGAACEGADQPPCANGLFCLGKDDTNKTAGTCKTQADVFTGAAGAGCDVKAQLCVTGQSCALAAVAGTTYTGTCVATGSYAAGAACKLGVPEACATGNYCKTAALTPFDGTCTALPQKGEDCGKPGSGDVCGPNLVCVSRKCQSLVANGVSCVGNAECFSESCVSGGCQAKVACK